MISAFPGQIMEDMKGERGRTAQISTASTRFMHLVNEELGVGLMAVDCAVSDELSAQGIPAFTWDETNEDIFLIEQGTLSTSANIYYFLRRRMLDHAYTYSIRHRTRRSWMFTLVKGM
jgi:hypothetical protein